VPLDTGHNNLADMWSARIVPQPLSSQPFAMSRVPVIDPVFNHPRANLASSPCTTDLYMRMRWDMTGASCQPHRNMYMKVDLILQAEQEKFADFALLSVQFLTHHHW